MDDTTWFAYNRTAMQKTLDIASSFFNINGIQANGDKSVLITTNKNEEEKQKGVILSNTKVIPITPEQATRILGVWVTTNGNKKYQKLLVESKIETTARTMTWKQITDKQARYIINQVLFPSIEYLLNDMTLTEKECSKYNSKINKVFRHKAHLASTAPDCILHMESGYKLFNIWDRQVLTQGKNWITRMSNNDLCTHTAEIRLQQLQNKCWSTYPITTHKLPFWIKI